MVPVRRRRSLALSLATGGLPTAHGAGSTLRGMWLGVASTEDQDCVLQGQQSTCELRDDVVRLSGLHVSPTVINERDGGAVSKLQPRRESGRDEVHENADQTVESAQPRTSQHRGHRAGLQPRLAGLDELLGRFHRSALYPLLRYFNHALRAWVMNKHKRFRGKKTRAGQYLQRMAESRPSLFAHWRCGMTGVFA